MPSLIVNVHTVASSLGSNDSASSGTILVFSGSLESTSVSPSYSALITW